MSMQDRTVTIGALALGVGAVTAHHVGNSGMDSGTIVKLAQSEIARGIAFGAAGGAIAGIVTQSSVSETLWRVAVGGFLAAVAAPWMAETILQIPTSSTAYPVLCSSIGILGFQIVRRVMEDPSVIPVIGKAFEPIKKNVVEPDPKPAGGYAPEIPRAPSPASSRNPRPIRAPLVR